MLRPGGTFTAVFRTRAVMKDMPFAPFGFTMYEQADWEAVLRANGFAVSYTVLLREGAVEFEGNAYSPESLVMTAVPNWYRPPRVALFDAKLQRAGNGVQQGTTIHCRSAGNRIGSIACFAHDLQLHAC